MLFVNIRAGLERLRLALKVSAIAERIHEELIGRAAVNVDDLVTLSKYLVPGDHLEIGTLFGCSAIFAALVKNSGTVTCIDPLDGYYMSNDRLASEKDLTGFTPSLELLQENAAHFEVELKVVQALSDPWPLGDAQFATAFIDGDHWDDGPRNDWNNVKDRVSHYVIFHDWPIVEDAIQDPAWKLVEQSGFIGVMGRRLTVTSTRRQHG